LRVHVQTVYKWVRQGKLKASKPGGAKNSRLKVSAESVRAMLPKEEPKDEPEPQGIPDD
jgi:predicted site-specific integrase-resolvase